MTFVEMKIVYVSEAHVPQHPEAAYPKYQLLAQPVFVVPSVKFCGKCSVFREVFRAGRCPGKALEAGVRTGL